MRIRNRLLVIFALLICFILISFFVNQRLSAEILRNGDELYRSEEVIRNSNQIHKAIIDMQSGYRGFLLTGEGSFLNSFTDGLKTIPTLMADQHRLVTLSAQNQRLDTIAAIHRRWVSYASHLIHTKMENDRGIVTRYNELFKTKVKNGTGKKMNDEINNVFLSFDSEEYNLRYQRRLTMQNSIRSNTRIQVIIAIISTFLSLLFSIYLTRHISQRINTMVQFADEISKGNFIKLRDERNDEMKELSNSLNTMSATLKRTFRELTSKNNELDQFAYVVSHDLKAPLRGIDNLSTWIEEDHGEDLSADVHEKLKMIRGRTRRLENLINGLLEYARIDKAVGELETVDVWQIINEQLDLLVPENFIVRLKGDFPKLFTVRVHLEQVFANLISNAVKYNDKLDPMIIITCLQQKDVYLFSVSDNGEGFESTYSEKIFTIFQTLKERDAFESTGVGLAIVKRIIERKKTKIEVQSIPGQGSVFSFTWPNVDPDMNLIALRNEKNIVG